MSQSPLPPDARTRFSAVATVGPWLLLAGATLLVYLPAIHGGPIIDDPEHITRPGLRSLGGLWRIWFEVGATAHYYPLLNTVFWLEYHLWGEAVSGYHLVNVLQHAASACLVVAIVRRLALPGAWLAGLIFALHPVCVESVAWMSEQKNTLSGLFFLASGFTYLGFDEHRRPSGYWLAFGLFVLALLTKSVTATLAPTLLVISWWRRGRLGWRRDVLPLLPWFVVGVAAGLFSAWFERVHSNAEGAAFDLTLLERCLVAGRAIVFYLRTLVWPSNLMFINPRWEVDTSATWQYAYPLSVIAVAALLLWLARRRRGPLAAFLIYLGTLLPALGFLDINWFNFSWVADHFQYLAGLGLIVPFAASAAKLASRLGPARAKAASLAAGILAVVLGVLTWRQSATYRDAETLYRATIERNPACWLAHNNLGAILLDRPGSLPQAISHFQAALRLKPDHARAYNNLGNALARLPARLPEAIAAYRTSLQLQHNVPEVQTNLASALARTPGGEDEAIATYRTALQLDPNHWEAQIGLADTLARQPGHEEEAVAAYSVALKSRPDSAVAHNNMASLLTTLPGRLPEAVAEYRTAIRLNPDNAEAHNNLGSVLAQTPGGMPEAIAAFEAALRLKPDYAEAHYNLASVLVEIPDRLLDAIDHFEAALDLAPDDPAIHNNLGNALMRLPERRADAIRHLETALRLAPDMAEAHFNLGRIHLTPPVDERAALEHFEAAARLQPRWEAARRLAAELRARAK